MAQSSHGLHHFHRRKKLHKLNELYPTKDPLKRFMDKAIYVVGVFGPLMTIPQVIKIWGDKTAAGVSLISWVSYLNMLFSLNIYNFPWETSHFPLEITQFPLTGISDFL